MVMLAAALDCDRLKVQYWKAIYTANISVVIITIFRSVSIPIVIWL